MTRPASFRLVVAVGAKFTDKIADRPKEVGGRRELNPGLGCSTTCQMVLFIG